jgi:hypothetical protein
MCRLPQAIPKEFGQAGYMRPVVEILCTRLPSGSADSRGQLRIRQESRHFAGKVNAVARFGE